LKENFDFEIGSRINMNLGRQFKHVFSKNTSYLFQRGIPKGIIGQRHFWGWLNSIFNRYDKERVKEVGPDRACAEWLIRCGAGVKWAGGADWFRDYNALPATYDRSLKIVEVDATDSAVMFIGFPHFRGVRHCRKMVFHKASYFDDMCVSHLVEYAKDNLKELQISSCGNLTSEGVFHISNLVNLEKLLLYDLPEVNNREECLTYLTHKLPQCQVEFPYAQASEREAMKKEANDKEK